MPLGDLAGVPDLASQQQIPVANALDMRVHSWSMQDAQADKPLDRRQQ